MHTQRAYIYKEERAPKPIMALECSSVSDKEAKVPAHVSLRSIRAGMIFRLVKDRKPVMASTRAIESVDQKKTGQSTITFVGPKAVPADDQGQAAVVAADKAARDMAKPKS